MFHFTRSMVIVTADDAESGYSAERDALFETAHGINVQTPGVAVALVDGRHLLVALKQLCAQLFAQQLKCH